jgi:electron transfer flavoprotein alpha/beta subunit
MGPPKAALAVREVIAMGCDSAILITDRAVAGSDTWAASYVLSAAIRQLVIEGGNVDLVICGEHGIGHKRKKYMPLVVSQEYLGVLRSTKKALDHNSIPNPGKIFDA